MEKRPKIKLELTHTDKAIELIGWVALVAIWILTMVNYSNLPDIIPIHYNGKGAVDSFGSKTNILTLLSIATVLFVGLTLLNRFPHIFNYPVNITNENAKKQYTLATRLIRYLKLIFVVIFGFIILRTIQTAKGQVDGLGTWFLPLLLVMIFIPVIYVIVRSIKGK
jgi:uncharacterized membrane protein